MENTKEKLKISNRTLIIILSVLIVFTAVIGTAWALFSDKEEGNSQIQIGSVNVDLLENWPELGEPINPDNPDETYDEFGIRKYEKSIQGHSTGDIPAYVRIRCIPIVQYYDEDASEWITASVSQDDIMLVMNGDDWKQSGDFWYYKKVLKGNEKTEALNIDWRILEIPSEISTKKMRTDVRIVLEYAQASNGMWKEIFGINELPSEVEQYQE